MKTVWIVLIATLFLAGCDQTEEVPPQTVRAIKTYTVTEPSGGNAFFYPGVIEAADSSGLSFRVAGTVQTVDVNLGDSVAKGQVLATLDTEPFDLDMQAAQADLQNAESAYTEKSNDLDRKKELFTKGWISKAALDQAQSSMESTRSQVSYANSRLSQARRSLADTKLVAPFEGLIGKRDVEPFVDVSAGQQIFTLDSAEAFEVTISIPEKVISRMSIGMPATITFQAVPDVTLNGRVTEIGRVASAANVFPVKVSVASPPSTIRSGMTAEVRLMFVSENEQEGFYIPLQAIAPGDQEGQGYVFVYDPETSTVKKTPITGSAVRENLIAVTGLKAGDIVASAGVTFLVDGQKVKLLQAQAAN